MSALRSSMASASSPLLAKRNSRERSRICLRKRWVMSSSRSGSSSTTRIVFGIAGSLVSDEMGCDRGETRSLAELAPQRPARHVSRIRCLAPTSGSGPRSRRQRTAHEALRRSRSISPDHAIMPRTRHFDALVRPLQQADALDRRSRRAASPADRHPHRAPAVPCRNRARHGGCRDCRRPSGDVMGSPAVSPGRRHRRRRPGRPGVRRRASAEGRRRAGLRGGLARGRAVLVASADVSRTGRRARRRADRQPAQDDARVCAAVRTRTRGRQQAAGRGVLRLRRRAVSRGGGRGASFAHSSR